MQVRVCPVVWCVSLPSPVWLGLAWDWWMIGWCDRPLLHCPHTQVPRLLYLVFGSCSPVPPMGSRTESASSFPPPADSLQSICRSRAASHHLMSTWLAPPVPAVGLVCLLIFIYNYRDFLSCIWCKYDKIQLSHKMQPVLVFIMKLYLQVSRIQ